MPKVEVTQEALMEIFNDVMTSQLFEKMAEEIVELVDNKNKAYGDAWQRYGIFTPLIRINDKILRLKTLSLHQEYGALVPDENIQDTLKDIVGYALLALLWIRVSAELYVNSDKYSRIHDAIQEVANKYVAK